MFRFRLPYPPTGGAAGCDTSRTKSPPTRAGRAAPLAAAWQKGAQSPPKPQRPEYSHGLERTRDGNRCKRERVVRTNVCSLETAVEEGRTVSTPHRRLQLNWRHGGEAFSGLTHLARQPEARLREIYLAELNEQPIGAPPPFFARKSCGIAKETLNRKETI